MFVQECNAIYDFIYYAVWIAAEYIYIYINQKTNVDLNKGQARADLPICY